MSLPDFDSHLSLFGLAAQRDRIFKAEDPYRLFWGKVYPLLAASRENLAACYCEDNRSPKRRKSRW